MKPMNDNVFVDSNLWLYAFIQRPGEEAKHRRALILVDTATRYIISTQVVAEVSVNLLRKAKMPESAVLDIIEDLYAQCRVVETGLQCHRCASRLRSAHGFSFWDSLIVAAALESACRTLYSEDMQHGQVVEGTITILNPLLEGS